MNIRTTAFLFCLSLGMLWLFGLMLAYKRTSSEKGLILPTLESMRDADIETLMIEFKDKGKQQKLQFSQTPAGWTLGKNKIRVDSVHLKKILDELKSAVKNDETQIPSDNGVEDPRITVTITGARGQTERKWTIQVGRATSDKRFVFVRTSELPNVIAVDQTSIETLFFTDINRFRSKRPFQFTEASVKRISIKRDSDPGKKDDKAAELEIKRTDDDFWRIATPTGLGYADVEGQKPKEPPPSLKPEEPKDKDKDKDKETDETKAKGGVLLLLSQIRDLTVEDAEKDFIPALDNIDLSLYGLEDGKERLRIEINTSDKDEAKNEVVLIGNKDPEEDKYFARMAGDKGVFKLSGKKLEAIRKVVNNPKDMRSKDILFVDTKKVDLIRLGTGQEEFLLSRPDDKSWRLRGDNRSVKASTSAIDALMKALDGKREIMEFADAATDSEFGIDNSAFSISLYEDTKPKGEEKKPAKEATKDDKEKKDDKFAMDTEPMELTGKGRSTQATFKNGKPRSFVPKEDKLVKAEIVGDKIIFTQIGDPDKEDKTIEFLIEGGKDEKDKHDVKIKITVLKKPSVVLYFGKVDGKKIDGKEVRGVKRVLQDGTEQRFYLTKELCDKIISSNIFLAYLDNALPSYAPDEVASLTIERGKEKLEIVRTKADRWIYKNAPSSQDLADTSLTTKAIREIVNLQAVKWLQKVDSKTDLAKFGLNPASLTATVIVKKTEAKALASFIGLLSGSTVLDAALAKDAFLAAWAVEPGQKVTLRLGKESDDEKDKGTYALFTVEEPKDAKKEDRKETNDLLFLIPTELAKRLMKEDFHDRTMSEVTQGVLDAGAAAAGPWSALAGAPLLSPTVLNFDATKVEKIVLETRRYEKRKFVFERDKSKDPPKTDKDKEKEKDKTQTPAKAASWLDKSGITDFQLDSKSVNKWLEELAKLDGRLAAIADGQRAFQKLDPKDAVMNLEIYVEGKTEPIKLIVGAPFGEGYFALSSTWPKFDAKAGSPQPLQPVFIIPSLLVDRALRGASYFGKDLIAEGQ